MDEIKETATCCICTELFTDPRLLTCNHALCLSCVNGMLARDRLGPGDSMPCPLCSVPFVIPANEVSAFTRNISTELSPEQVNTCRNFQKPTLCEFCAEDNAESTGRVPEAAQYCVQCQQHICNSCSRLHTKIKALKEHQLVPLESSSIEGTSEIQVTPLSKSCDRHTGEEKRLYCHNCKEVVCTLCSIGEHGSHNCTDVQEAGYLFRGVISANLNRLKKFCDDASEDIQKVINDRKTLDAEVLEARGAIIRFAKDLLDQLSSIVRLRSKRLEDEKTEIAEHVTAVENLMLYSSRLVSKGTPVEICQNVSDLLVRIKDLQKIHAVHVQRQQQQGLSTAMEEVVFEAATFDGDFLKVENMLGVIKVKSEKNANGRKRTDTQVSIKSNGHLDLSSYSAVFITGITKQGSDIFALCVRPKLILIFDDRTPFLLRKEIDIKETKSPSGIVSSETSGCTYILDVCGNFKCIWKMTTTSDDHRLTKWLTKMVDNPYSLSISSDNDDRLLVVGRNQPNIGDWLEIYGSDGKLIRRISLPTDIQEPEYCVQKPDGDFVIIHKTKDDLRSTISRLSSDGQKIICQFRPVDGSSDELSNPCCLSVDRENSRVFVADCGSDRVVLFDSGSLRSMQVVLAQKDDDIFGPSVLHYDSRKRQLIVVHKTIDVYAIL